MSPVSKVDQIKALNYGMQFKDARLYEILNTIADELKKINEEIFPIVTPSSTQTGSGAPVIVSKLSSINYILGSNYIGLSWVSPGTDVVAYEIRLGVNWDTAERLTTTTLLSALFDPLTTGTHVFQIKCLDANQNYSEATSVSVIVPSIGAVSITPSVIDNNVLLYWTVPSSAFQISHYNLYKDGVLVGSINGTFATVFESASGTYVYKIVAVDIAGSIGADSSVSLFVNQPPDFQLEAEHNSNFWTVPATVTLTDVSVELGYLWACLDTSESWDDHFDTRGWGSIEDQINAGFPLYCQPTLTTGSYEEKFDYGVTLNNVVASIDWSYLNVSGSVGITCKIRYSTDDIVWSAYATGKQLYIPSLRYIQVLLEFSGSAGDIIKLSNLRFQLSVKQHVDSGSLDVYSADAGGTTVTFNLPFKDVNSITVTPNSTSYRVVIFDFVDAPNPTTFKVLAFNSAGARVDCNVSWKARGVM